MPFSENHGDDLARESEDLSIERHYLDFNTPLPILQSNINDVSNMATSDLFAKATLIVNPQLWSASRKAFIMSVACLATVFASVAPSSYSPGAEQIAAEFSRGRVETLTGVTIFTIGFAVTPMVLAPLSEVYGRKPVFTVTGVLYVVTTLCCGLTPTFGG
jgi:hypothetical protein